MLNTDRRFRKRGYRSPVDIGWGAKYTAMLILTPDFNRGGARWWELPSAGETDAKGGPRRAIASIFRDAREVRISLYAS